MGMGYHTLIIMPDGSVKASGNNSFGQLGIGASANKNVFVDVPITGVKQIACGLAHTIFLMQDGTVKGVGRNEEGQLGIGSTVSQSQIVTIQLTGVKAIACGFYYTVFLMKDGTVRTAGSNDYGQLGIGGVVNRSTIQDPGLSKVIAIACGSHHSLFLLEDGSVQGTGSNNMRQLVASTGTTNSYPIDTTMREVKDVTCSASASYFLMKDGSIKVIGYNTDGQLGIGTSTTTTTLTTLQHTGVQKVIAGFAYSLLLFADGTVKASGNNAYGQFATADTTARLTHQTIPVTNVLKVSTGYHHTVFLLKDLTVKTAGYNYEGQLGNGNNTNSSTLQSTGLTGVSSIMDSGMKLIAKFLIKVGTLIKNIQNGLWVDVGSTPATKAMFDTYGMTDLAQVTDGKIKELASPELLVWTDDKTASPKLIMKGESKPQVVLGLIDIATFTLASVRVVASSTGTVRILVSGDSGVSWKGKQIVDPSNLADVKAYGFTATELNALTQAQLAELAPNRKIRFAYYFEQASMTDVASVSAMYVNEKKYTATPNVSALQFTHDFATKQEPVIELKQNDGTWIEVKKDEITYAKAGQEWAALEVRAKLKNDQQLNAIAYSWT